MSAEHKWSEEWKEAARELFGSKDKRTVDEALASVQMPTAKKATSTDTEEAKEYTGTSALVAVKEDETAWQKVSARFREAPIIQGILDAAKKAARTEAGKKVSERAKFAKDKIGDAREEALEFWETSQNPYVRSCVPPGLRMCALTACDLVYSVGSTGFLRFTMVSSVKRQWESQSSTSS